MLQASVGSAQLGKKSLVAAFVAADSIRINDFC